MMKRLAFILSLYCLHLAGFAQAFRTRDPDSIKIITSDIANFWDAFDRLSSATTTSDSNRILHTWYLEKGSYGLKEYLTASHSIAQDFTRSIRTHYPAERTKYGFGIIGIAPIALL